MDTKAWYKSKAVWGGILALIAGLSRILMNGEISPEDVETIGVGLGIIGIRFKLN